MHQLNCSPNNEEVQTYKMGSGNLAGKSSHCDLSSIFTKMICAVLYVWLETIVI